MAVAASTGRRSLRRRGAIWGAGASLTQPLFHGGALRARERQYQAAYKAAVALYR